MKLISRSLAGFFSVLAAALAIIAVFHLTSWGKDAGPAIKVDTTTLERSPQLGTSFAPVVKKAAPSVVNIYSTHIIHMRPFRNPFFNDPVFRQFFGGQFGPDDNREITRRQQSLGSGVIISPGGYILTANHVVDGAEEIKVAVGDSDSKKFTAKVVGTDPPTDVAVLKIDAKDLPAITLGDSDQLEVGDVVLAIGDPFGVGQTVTRGIVSALGRSGLRGFNQYQDFIQTDAAINPGNSGGALVDAEGRLVGINTAIIPNENGGNQGIGFAVPVNLARHSMERLIASGRISRGYLVGITMQDITPDLAQGLNLAIQNGVLVNDVLPGTPVAKSGIKPDDVIVAFNGKDVADRHSLQLAVSECPPGSQATMKLIRNGAAKIINIKLAELPGDGEQSPNEQSGSSQANSKTGALDGVTVADLDQEVRQQLQLPDNIQGVVVTDVDADSNSTDAGLQRGNVIVEINRHSVSNTDKAVELCKQARGNQILLKIWRREGGLAGTRYLSVDNTAKGK
ncbi:MAG: Do family serine endopeptidase [Verrucomicrobiota bacterium]